MYLKVIRNFLIRSFFYSNAKKHKKTKNQDKFWSDSRFLNWEILNYFNKIKNSLFFNLLPKLYQTMKLKPNQTLFYRTYLNLTLFSLVKKKLKSLTDFQNLNFSVLWLKWTQTMETGLYILEGSEGRHFVKQNFFSR